LVCAAWSILSCSHTSDPPDDSVSPQPINQALNAALANIAAGQADAIGDLVTTVIMLLPSLPREADQSAGETEPDLRQAIRRPMRRAR